MRMIDRKTLRNVCLGTFVASCLVVGSRADAQAKPKPPPAPPYTSYLTGNGGDVNPSLHGPALDLGGGGTDVDAAFQNTIDKVRGCTSCSTKIDIVILRSTGADGYNDYLYAMNGVDSVETFVITSPAAAADAALIAKIQNAEFVFFAGGDQCDYVTNFAGTPIEAAVQSVYARGGAVGGTSAGLAVLGDYAYDACTSASGITSATALKNPYHKEISFTNDFFDFTPMGDVLTDSHFVVRDRMGRLMVFLARQIQDGVTNVAWGLGVDEEASVVVDNNGIATVTGVGAAYLVLADHAPTLCQAKKPLSYSGFKVWKYTPGQSFNLNARPTTGYTTINVNAGVLSANPY